MRMFQVLAVMTAVLGLAACSSSGESEGSGTTTSEAPVSTEPSTATSGPAPSTTSSSSTLTTVALSDEEQVLAVFDAYMGFEFDERANGYGPSEVRIGQYTTGALKQRALETLHARKNAEAFLEGTASIRVETVAVQGDEALVRACYQDGSTAVFTDGSIASDLADEPHIIEVPALRTDGAWLLAERIAGGNVACEL